MEQDIVFRIRTARIPGTLARVLTRIAEYGAHIGEIETLAITREYNIRDVTVIAPSEEAAERIREAVRSTPGVEVVGEIDRVVEQHRGGKLRVEVDADVENVQDMREVYTPGVARVARAIADDPAVADELTWRGRTVAVVTNGTRVLGLGDIGPAAALPVMEGKALFYSLLVDLNAVPIVLDERDPDRFVETVASMADGFGGIHLEDIASPEVYAIEEGLDARLTIPVMHDDQHGTAVVVLAAVLSAARKVGRRIEDLVFTQIGLGAAGSAIARLALGFGFARVVAYDPNPAAVERLRRMAGDDARLQIAEGRPFEEVVADADVLVLTTGRPGLLPPELVRQGQIVFAISNPQPEIDMDVAERAGAAIAADGSIVNNVLAYPGLFKGALLAKAPRISDGMKQAAARTLADLAALSDTLLPDPLDRTVHEAVTQAVAAAALETGSDATS